MKKNIFYAFLCLIVFLFSNETQAFSQPIVQKAIQAQNHLINIGRALITISFIVAVILLLSGKPQWIWCMYIVLSGVLLTSVNPIVQWIIS